MSKNKLNGGVDLLAQAMRTVFAEAVKEGMGPAREDLRKLNQKVDGVQKELHDGLETVNKNVQSQLAQNRKDGASDLRKELARRN